MLLSAHVKRFSVSRIFFLTLEAPLRCQRSGQIQIFKKSILVQVPGTGEFGCGGGKVQYLSTGKFKIQTDNKAVECESGIPKIDNSVKVTLHTV